MAIENLVANIDIVNYPEDKYVHLARTKEVLSVGVIGTPYNNKVLTVNFMTESKVAKLDIQDHISLFKALEVYVSSGKTDAILLATMIVKQWLEDNSNDEDKSETGDSKIEFTHVAKDAKPYQPHMTKFSEENLDFKELINQEARFAKVQEQSLAVPIEIIINSIKDKLTG